MPLPLLLVLLRPFLLEAEVAEEAFRFDLVGLRTEEDALDLALVLGCFILAVLLLLTPLVRLWLPLDLEELEHP